MTLPLGQEQLDARASILEADHCILGGLITMRWQLLESTQEAVVHHHAPSQAPTQRGKLIASFVSLADCVAKAIGAGFGSEEIRLERETIELLQITRSGFDALCAETKDQFEQILELYAA